MDRTSFSSPSTSSQLPVYKLGGRRDAIMSSTRRFIIVEDLILSVQEHPELYDKQHEKHSDLLHCRLLWERITRQFVPEFDSLDSRKQAKEIEKIKIKWRSIRDSFIKDLKAEKEEQRSGSGASKRTPYCHRALLQFLRPTLRNRATEDNFDALEDSNEAPALSVRDESPETSMDTLHTINVDDIADDEEPCASRESSTTTESQGPVEEPSTERASTADRQRRQASARVAAARGQSRSANVQMAGAVSSLVGMMRNQEAMVSRRFQDQSSTNIGQQYKEQIDSLRKQLEESNELLHKERLFFQEQRQTLTQQHRQEIDRLMQHQNSHLYYIVMSLLPILEQVPRHRLVHCHTSLLDAVKNHLDYSSNPTRPLSTWQPSSTQPYHVPPPHAPYQSYQPPTSFPITSAAEERSTFTQLLQGAPNLTSTPTSAPSERSSGNYMAFTDIEPKI